MCSLCGSFPREFLPLGWCGVMRLFARVLWGAGSWPRGGPVMFSGCSGIPLCRLLVAGVVGGSGVVGGGGFGSGESGVGVGVGDCASGSALVRAV